jgi:NAD(P)H-dependent FMN reductase
MKIFNNFLRHLLIYSILCTNIGSLAAKASQISEQEGNSMKVGIIISSTRPNRIGEQVARWVLEAVSQTRGLDFKLVDLLAFNLPIFNEPGIPSRDPYVYDYTKKWSTEISSYQAFIIVTPEYNAGYPSSLKNALDYLYKEWNEKPVVIVSYGYHGGSRCAAQLKQILENGLKMKVINTMPALTLNQNSFGEDKKLKNPDQDFAVNLPAIKSSIDELKQVLSVE